jgi:hypothetical protein
MRNKRKISVLATVASATALLVAVFAAPAPASQAISSFGVATTTTEAGGHPDLSASFSLSEPGMPEAAESVAINFPEGVFGNPNAVPTCTIADFALMQCPMSSQVGTITVRGNYEGDPEYLLGTAPIYDIDVQTEGETARLSFIVPIINIPISMPIEVRTGGDYGLRMTVSGITQAIPLASATATVWGFPLGNEHSNERFVKGAPGEPAGCPGKFNAMCASNGGQAPHPTFMFAKPFIDNPSTCTGKPLVVSLDVRTYQDPTQLTHAEDQYPPTTGCEFQTFRPVLNVRLTSNEADSPSGMDLTFRSPLPLSKGTTPSNIRTAIIELPEGVSINPDAADGQTACTAAQANFGSEGPAHCPDSAKIGNFDIVTPALIAPLQGSLYFAEPVPGDQYRLFMVASGFGINAKIVASVKPDPQTGQLTVVAANLPQVPFEEFNLHVFSSDRGLIATPTRCTIYQVDSTFHPWNDRLAYQHSRPSVAISSGPNGGPCPGSTRPFEPRLVAGMSNPIAGAFSAFSLKLDRDDGDQFLGDLNFTMPPGLTGSLRGLEYCSEAAIAQAAQQLGRTEMAFPSCRARSFVGTTTVAAGPGRTPFYASGKMYLAGPFKGAPLSLVAITPAVAGPYDYGNQVVRVALHVDPLTAQVKAVSDTVPSIIGGVPIRMRTIQVNIDKPEFTINPTNCDSMSIDSQGIGDEGTVASFSSYFHAVNCSALAFRPSMSIRQIGRNGTTRSKNPKLQFDLRTRAGDANIKTMAVTLSSAFQIDQEHLGNICSEKELAEKQCAGRTPIGRASTTTPLLDEPIGGPVYAVSGSGGLPRLAFILNGQVNLVPRAETRSLTGKKGVGRLHTVVPVVPDAPIGHFRLTIFGGKNGYLSNTRNICANPAAVKVAFTAQSGRARSQNLKVKATCGKKAKKK